MINRLDPFVFCLCLSSFILADGREISAPLEWFPRLRDATDAERQEWRFIGNGLGVHWSNIDEDISVSLLMRGND